MNNSEIVYTVSSKLEVKKSKLHGYGVHAVTDITKGELLEISRLLKLDWRMKYQNDGVIRDYCWSPRCECKDCKIHGQHMYIALGFASLYNHSDEPNTNIELDYPMQTMTIVANKDIKTGEEIFVSYGSSYWKTRNKT